MPYRAVEAGRTRRLFHFADRATDEGTQSDGPASSVSAALTWYLWRRSLEVAESSSASGGIGFTGLLAILFIGLKLGGVIDWSWWWVLSPIWISFLFGVVVLVGLIAIAVAANR
jgi:hypothetical protein